MLRGSIRTRHKASSRPILSDANEGGIGRFPARNSGAAHGAGGLCVIFGWPRHSVVEKTPTMSMKFTGSRLLLRLFRFFKQPAGVILRSSRHALPPLSGSLRSAVRAPSRHPSSLAQCVGFHASVAEEKKILTLRHQRREDSLRLLPPARTENEFFSPTPADAAP